jgi:putative transposase
MSGMSLRKKPFVPGEYYHVYNRGNSKQKIFHDKQDYERFINLLYLSNTRKNFRINDISKDFLAFDRGVELLVSIGAYTLMPNHFHILITQKNEGSISKFMQKLTTAYSMYYNQKYTRTGGLFEGKFKSQYATDNRYLKYLFSYIHLNIIKLIQKDWKKDGVNDKQYVLQYLEKYNYSSYRDYLDIVRPEGVILEKKDFPDYFPKKEKFKKEIFEWLSYGEK